MLRPSTGGWTKASELVKRYDKMGNYTVDAVTATNENDFNGLDRTFMVIEGKSVYLLHKPENRPHRGDVLDGTIAPDKRGNLKFTKTKKDFQPNQPPLVSPESTAKTYKADPDKMKQEYTLDVARNMSIQRQVCLKGAIELIVAGKRDYDELVETYVDLMELASEIDWESFKGRDIIPEDVMGDDDLEEVLTKMTEDPDAPPLDVYDAEPF